MNVATGTVAEAVATAALMDVLTIRCQANATVLPVISVITIVLEKNVIKVSTVCESVEQTCKKKHFSTRLLLVHKTANIATRSYQL